MLIRDEIISFCREIGPDPLLVQGPGGNISWKEGNTLWIKASGTWLADAGNRDIFVPVDLSHLQREMSNGNFAATPKVVSSSELRPSIETLLHAVTPQRVVVHLHAIDILAWLVRKDAEELIQASITDSLSWNYLPYLKPGPKLANAIFHLLRSSEPPDVLFLQNHGLVIAAETVQGVKDILQHVLKLSRTKPPEYYSEIVISESPGLAGYSYSNDQRINNLSFNFIKYIEDAWALYPDHLVFLGRTPAIVENYRDLNKVVTLTPRPPLIFFRNKGTLECTSLSNTQRAQILCYYDVVRRQKSIEAISVLTDNSVNEIIGMESEHYRLKLGQIYM